MPNQYFSPTPGKFASLSGVRQRARAKKGVMLQKMKLEDIHLHDSVICRVTENTEEDTLSFEVDYPVDWENDSYERKVIKFTDVLNYQVHEGSFLGPPTFLDWSIVGNENDRDIVRLETSAGYRQLSFKEVELSNAT